MAAVLSRPCAAAFFLACAAAVGCTGPPPPTKAARLLAKNPKATVSGRVVDEEGRPVAGVRVQAIPGGDSLWDPPGTTDAQGRFRLTLDAPAEYAFLVFEGDVAVVTPLPKDPARVRVALSPGEEKDGVELTLLSSERKRYENPPARPEEPAPEETPSP